jgi:hypothetical protein
VGGPRSEARPPSAAHSARRARSCARERSCVCVCVSACRDARPLTALSATHIARRAAITRAGAQLRARVCGRVTYTCAIEQATVHAGRRLRGRMVCILAVARAGVRARDVYSRSCSATASRRLACCGRCLVQFVFAAMISASNAYQL